MIITPDDLDCGEIYHCGSFNCDCGCDTDTNIGFLDLEGMKKVTHLKCRACGKLYPFWLNEGDKQAWLDSLIEDEIPNDRDT